MADSHETEERSTTDRLMDTAERLFAEHGYDGVGMRALASEAGVNLGATTYHFGSKERLYIETFMRRFRPANEERLALLRAAQSALGKSLTVEKIVDCMLRPPFMTVLAHPHFPALLARNFFMPPPFMQELLLKEMPANSDPFVEALAEALPHLPPEVLRMRSMFGAGVLFLFSGNLSRLPIRQSPEFCEFVLQQMVSFISAGLRAPAAAGVPFPFPNMNPGVSPNET